MTSGETLVTDVAARDRIVADIGEDYLSIPYRKGLALGCTELHLYRSR